MSDFNISVAISGPDVSECAALLAEYGRSLPVSLSYQGFATELSQLPGSYAPPDGRLLLARDRQRLSVGCVALRRLSSTDAELKRLYVRPATRGSGLGKLLVLSAIAEARSEGYAAIRLDTLASMRAATGLYQALGFVETPAYYCPTPPGTRFFRLELGAPTSMLR